MIIMILNLYNKQNGSNRLPFHTYHSNSAGETIIKIENADNNSLCTVGYPVSLQESIQCFKSNTKRIKQIDLLVYCLYYN